MSTKFYCSNKNCSLYDKTVNVGQVKWIINSKGEAKPNTVFYCAECGEPLSYTDVFEGIGNTSVSSFSSMSDEQKRAEIHKRAQNHFNKVGKDEKKWRHDNIIKKHFSHD